MVVGPAELKTLSRLLDEALALHPSERGRWLASLSERDARHRGTLAQLLAEAENPNDGFLTRPGIDDLRASAGQDAATELPGMRVGPYQLERPIGSGGMGSVWLARRVDGVLERAVALKLPHVSWVPGLNARLGRERDILARLTHPNIARLYDAGTDERGRPYLALEYVEGEPIDTYVKRNSLDLRQRLLLFKQVASAVAYAHIHLVVHRDLKPSNVLVDTEGNAHLLDFGVAKLLSDEAEGLTQLTRAAGRMLTPGYASPEQIHGQPVTVASDVYSLGVLLFEMLTGTRPFHVTGASLTELEAAATEELPPLASSRVAAKPTQRALRGDLDTILAKALRREPEARYRTVDALIDDLDRHMNGEPVLARPASGWYRASRFVSRHRDYVALATSALIAVFVGTGIAVVQARRATEEARRAETQAERADAVRDFLIGLFDLKYGDQEATQGVDVRQLRADALIELGARRIHTQYQGRPALRAEMMGIAGTIFADIGDAKHAAEMANGELSTLAVSAGNDRQRVDALRTLARAQLQQMHNDRAEETLKQAILVGQSLPAAERADLHSSLAKVLISGRRYDEAGEQLAHAESLLSTREARRSATYSDLLFSRALLHLIDRKDAAGARSSYEAAVKLTDELNGPLSRKAIRQRQRFADQLIQFGEFDSGRAIYEGLIADVRRASGDDDLQAAELELRLIERLNDQPSALADAAVPRVEKIRALLAKKGASVPPSLRAYADLIAGVGLWQRGEVELAAPLMQSMLPVLVDDNQIKEDEAPAYATKYVAMYFYAEWADDRGEHGEATRLWDEIYKVRRLAGSSEGIRNDAILDPQILAVQSRIMAGDLQSATKRLADLKAQISTGKPGLVSSRWDPRWEALVLETLLKVESKQFTDAARLLDEWNTGVSEARRKELLIFTFPPSGIAGLQGIVECNTGKSKEGLLRLTTSINELKDQFAPTNPGLAALRARAGLCALQAGQPDLARQLREAARHAFTEQPAVSAFYKKPWLELERRLGGRDLAER